MKIKLNRTQIQCINHVLPHLGRKDSPLSGHVCEQLVTLVLIEWHQKNAAKLIYEATGFSAKLTPPQALAFCHLIGSTVLADHYYNIEFSELMNEILKKSGNILNTANT